MVLDEGDEARKGSFNLSHRHLDIARLHRKIEIIWVSRGIIDRLLRINRCSADHQLTLGERLQRKGITRPSIKESLVGACCSGEVATFDRRVSLVLLGLTRGRSIACRCSRSIPARPAGDGHTLLLSDLEDAIDHQPE